MRKIVELARRRARGRPCGAKEEIIYIGARFSGLITYYFDPEIISFPKYFLGFQHHYTPPSSFQ